MTEIRMNNIEYWEGRKRPGEVIFHTGFVAMDGFEYTVAFLAHIAELFERAINEHKSIRFELKWDKGAGRTYYCFFEPMTTDEGDQIEDPTWP